MVLNILQIKGMVKNINIVARVARHLIPLTGSVSKPRLTSMTNADCSWPRTSLQWYTVSLKPLQSKSN